MKHKTLSMALLLAVCASAHAGFVATGTDARQILAEQKQILNDVEAPTGKYSRFNEQAQNKLKAAQARIFALLEDGKTLEQLDKNEQVELLNSVEEVKAIISNNERDKLECWREKKTGSQMAITRCATVAQREEVREGARTWKAEPGICQRDGSGGPACGPPRKAGDVGF